MSMVLDAPSHPLAADAGSKRKALLILCAAQLMLLLDATIVNVALPSIRTSLGFTEASVAWTVNAYLIGMGGFLILGGRLGDLFGKKRILIKGLALFVTASLICAGSASPTMLVGARFAQGISGALASSVILGIVVSLFPEARERAQALGLYGFIVASGGAAGLILGGVLTSSFDWRWAFLINLPIGLVVIAMALIRVPDDRPAVPKSGADLQSAALLVGGMTALTAVIIEGGQWGWFSTFTSVMAACAIAMLAAFFYRHMHVPQPLIPLRIFNSRSLVAAGIAQTLLSGGMFGMFFFLALDFHDQRGFPAWLIGMSFLPAALTMAITALLVASRFLIRLGAIATLIIGLSSVGGALLWLSFAPADGTFVACILPPLLLYGFGGGLCFPALTTLGLSNANLEDAGAVSGLLNTAYQIGGALGLALLSALAARATDIAYETGTPLLPAMHTGHTLAYYVAGVTVLCAIPVLAIAARLKQERQA